LKKARQLWSQRQWEESLLAFEKAVAQEPSNVRVAVDAARAFGARYQFERADALLQRLLRLNEHNPTVMAHVGESYRLINRYPEAARCFERACALAQSNTSAELELARLYERLHRLEEAHQLIERVVRTQANWPLAQLTKAKIERRLKLDQSAEATLRALLANSPSNDPDVFAEAWAELAQILDRRGDYDGAMEAVVYSKQLMLPRDAAERQTSDFILARFQRLFESLGADDLRRWLERSQEIKGHPPLVLLTGFPRSGTTLLEQVLDSHPQLISSEERDIMGFEVFPALINSVADRASIHDVLERVGLDLLRQQQRCYFQYNEAWIGQSLGQRMLLDKNPGSTLLLPVFLRVFPQFRTLIALRDPRDVILSCFLLYLPLNPLSVSFLTLERTARRYALDMGGWLKLRELMPLSWLEVRYEDTVADVSAQARRVLDFLNLPWDPAVLAFRERVQSKAVLSPTYAAVTEPIHTRAIGRWRNYAEYLEPVLPIIEPLVKALGYSS
jgi:tetratricopeptide (TPR) repeat protein